MSTLRSLAITPTKSDRAPTVKPEEGEVRFNSLLAPKPKASELLSDWQAALNAEEVSVSEALLFEAKLAVGVGAVARQLPRGMTYLKTLHIARQQAALSVYNYARDVNWRRPVLFVQSLRVARGFLRDVVGHEEMTSESRRREFTGRLGVATVLMSRFDSVDSSDVTEAIAALERSLKQGNDPPTAVPYLLEASVLRFDLQPDPPKLLALMKRAKSYLSDLEYDENPAAQLAACDAYLRLASFAGRSARSAGLRKAAECVRLAFERHLGSDEVRALMLEMLINVAQDDPAILDDGATIGLRLPFGARSGKAPRLLAMLAGELTESIIDRANSGDMLAQGVCADLLAADQGDETPERLRRVVELRRGTVVRPGLSDERSVLLGIRDSLLLASLDGRDGARSGDLKTLIDMATRNASSASPLLLLAQDVESNGPISVLGPFSGEAGEIARFLETGDWRSLLALAAERALSSPDLAESPLGGRSEVTTVGDYYGLVSQNFVIKTVTSIALKRESERLAHLDVSIEAAAKGGVYGVTQHFVASDLKDGMKRSVRRFVPGLPVASVVGGASSEKRLHLLARVAGFLAFLNGVEAATSDGVRKELKEKEVYRWLRAIGIGEPLQTFDGWWVMVADVPPVRRRDAHLDNWVLADDGKLFAIDLEATGSRPLGYELAQITDDAPVFDPGDWGGRRRVFDEYVASLLGHLKVDPQRAWIAYQASVAARALRRLTWDQATPSDQSHAQATLDGLAVDAAAAELRDWVIGVLAAWRRNRGLSELPSSELVIDEHRRRRISKSMAYHLRHGPVVSLDPDGWASIQELTSAIGHRVSEQEIAIVASTLSDPRFEYRDGLVRARYGHSRRVEGAGVREGLAEYATKAFHATTIDAASSIIEKGEGLRPLSRTFVHLSRSAKEALLSGFRHGYPLLLSTDGERTTTLISRGGNTLVSPEIKVHDIQVEPLTMIWSVLPPVPFH
ncbi:RNA:NAD 2'-phosphotransferase (TPT1/KptA family) [Haloactinopolyspora alba]|uniref:RNA:NAD 2'-phosphotransferase (TPT1/KptA family) n=2 Tax=Haloactinopolyspora alba TaxID=648780 RepID=A0A2P8EF83_9ACTN|nr:RNA:NAD 2'-phosphotransferase (TPT1/KptA family) [Haloactinopolyspora alba]